MLSLSQCNVIDNPFVGVVVNYLSIIFVITQKFFNFIQMKRLLQLKIPDCLRSVVQTIMRLNGLSNDHGKIHHDYQSFLSYFFSLALLRTYIRPHIDTTYSRHNMDVRCVLHIQMQSTHVGISISNYMTFLVRRGSSRTWYYNGIKFAFLTISHPTDP